MRKTVGKCCYAGGLRMSKDSVKKHWLTLVCTDDFGVQRKPRPESVPLKAIRLSRREWPGELVD